MNELGAGIPCAEPQRVGRSKVSTINRITEILRVGAPLLLTPRYASPISSARLRNSGWIFRVVAKLGWPSRRQIDWGFVHVEASRPSSLKDFFSLQSSDSTTQYTPVGYVSVRA
jgi:hypothetical protein